MLVDFIKHYNMVHHYTILLYIYLYSIVSWCWNCFPYSLHNFRLFFSFDYQCNEHVCQQNLSHL